MTRTIPGAIALFPGGLGTPQLRPFPFTTHRSLPGCLAAEEQHSRACIDNEALGLSAGLSAGPSADDRASETASTVGSDADQRGGGIGFSHVSVMADEITTLFASAPVGGVVVDATLGAGGHTERLLDAYEHLSVIGLDRDRTAISAATERLARFGPRFQAHHTRFDQLAECVDTKSVDGVLFDLGVSSPQLDRGSRGFSYRASAPLDMRMDDRDSLTAADVVNTYDPGDLVRLLRDNADERHARRIVSGIVAARPIATTSELADIIIGAVPAAARRQPRHPAMRVFQAIRIEVNRELEVLEPALMAAIDSLRPGGRVAVLAYHSGEDRIVKSVLREESRTSPAGRPDLPPPTGSVTRLRLLWSGARKPSDEEIARNPRASSARFRAAERTEQGT